jgi:ketose-bisphosphate aldolase
VVRAFESIDLETKMAQKDKRPFSLTDLLHKAEQGRYAVGAFSPRYLPVIGAILRTGQRLRSPLIVQVAEVELTWYGMTLGEFVRAFWEHVKAERITVPIGLHLDHTQGFEVIQEAITQGFSSVMIDASARPLAENIAITRKVVEYAHPRGVQVEAELGRIGSADSVETQTDEELFTDPAEAGEFVRQTQVDALAVSVGTAHGVYTVHKPRIDVERLKAIRACTPVPLVLHGGSDTPKDLIAKAIKIPGGGVSKINIATDLELGFLKALGRKDRLTNTELKTIPIPDLQQALSAVEAVVEDKILHFLGSQGHAV